MVRIGILASLMVVCSWRVSSGQALTIASSKITFLIKNAGINVEGSFSSLNAAIVFDEKNLKSSSIEATLPAASIKTGSEMRDNHLRKEEYFSVKKYPSIRLKSTAIKSVENGYLGVFQLTIKGKTKEISIPFTYAGNVFKSVFYIKRTDYGVGTESWIMAEDVKLIVEIGVVK